MRSESHSSWYEEWGQVKRANAHDALVATHLRQRVAREGRSRPALAAEWIGDKLETFEEVYGNLRVEDVCRATLAGYGVEVRS